MCSLLPFPNIPDLSTASGQETLALNGRALKVADMNF
jgi:hypothetical protein